MRFMNTGTPAWQCSTLYIGNCYSDTLEAPTARFPKIRVAMYTILCLKPIVPRCKIIYTLPAGRLHASSEYNPTSRQHT